MAPPQSSTIEHASCVAIDGRAVLIRGASGSGKSALALQLVAFGARLVADDRTQLDRRGGALYATSPAPIGGLIEARGVGILRMPPVREARVALAVDLDHVAEERMPQPQTCDILGVFLPLLRRADGSHFAATVIGALRFGPPQLPPEPMPPETAETLSDSTARQRVVFVTGPSGAGRSTAIATLEDLGYEAIDNLPLSLLPRLLTGEVPMRPLALGIDVRNRDFTVDGFLATLDALAARPELVAEALYLDARPDVLSHRYTETRRRHPLAPGETPEDGIARETGLLEPLRARADVLIDTSELTPHDLRSEIERLYGGAQTPGLSVSVQSFSFKRGLPQGLDTVFDVRFLQNPHWQPDLRPLTGLDRAVARHVAADPRYDDFFGRLCDLLLFLLPAYADEGKTHFAVGLGCSGGRHRSVVLAGALTRALAEAGWHVTLRHRELERRAGGAGEGAA